MTEILKHVCPRRVADQGPFQYPDSDIWNVESGNLMCSYCGSLHPDYVLEMMRLGVELIPTDKNYKIYVRVFGVLEGKFYFQHFSMEQKQEFIDLYNYKPHTFTVGDPGHFYVLPYFMILERGVDDHDE